MGLHLLHQGMLFISLLVLILVLFAPFNETASFAPTFQLITKKCEFYNSTCESDPDSCDPTVDCESSKELNIKRNYCFVVWQVLPDGTKNVSLKGCVLNMGHCDDKAECIDNTLNPKNNVLFCCCEGDFCNREFTWIPTATEAPPSSTTLVPVIQESNEIYYLIGGLAVCSILLISFTSYYLWARKQKQRFTGIPTSEPNPTVPPSPQLECRPIQLIEIKARGRYGTVWKAQFKSEEVAVKIFPLQDKMSWQTEKQIFRLPYMDHPNILEFIGAEKRGDNLQAEFWLITAYHEQGSLCDYLKANTINFAELCKIAESMARGLAHLHESVHGIAPKDTTKPTIAHRDFKSKNVLLKSDLTACIADFGLAVTFEAGKSCGETHGQVGTRRYMAPEVLEGAISFTSDSFLRIDMYACGLVLWELVSRCKMQNNSPVPEYRLPFEEEVAAHPTLEDMQESVVQNKVRPVIQAYWRNHTGMTVLCDTMEECWDHDPEARLSASCVVERIMVQSRYHQKPVIILDELKMNPILSH